MLTRLLLHSYLDDQYELEQFKMKVTKKHTRRV